MQRTRWAIIGRGFNGWHAQSPDGNTNGSGGDLHDRPWNDQEDQIGYLADAIPGALVYDASGADWDAFVRLIVKGPMMNAGLPPATVGRFVTGRREAYDPANPPGALDEVSADVWRIQLAGLAGMKLGTVRAGGVDWDDGTRTERERVRPCVRCGHRLSWDVPNPCRGCERAAPAGWSHAEPGEVNP